MKLITGAMLLVFLFFLISLSGQTFKEQIQFQGKPQIEKAISPGNLKEGSEVSVKASEKKAPNEDDQIKFLALIKERKFSEASLVIGENSFESGFANFLQRYPSIFQVLASSNAPITSAEFKQMQEDIASLKERVDKLEDSVFKKKTLQLR